ncbi:MAG TPA: hypothetical protein VIP82_16640 [Microbacterium sp.]|uniref:hypothetical protein n=1 Tax=Microbacterium sp. TaxID=51671 RepID=UPI002F92FAAA
MTTMQGGRKLMRVGGAVTMLGLVGMVVGAAMLAYASAFGTASINTDQQRDVALLVAAVGAAAAIAGVSLVCMGLVLRPKRGSSKRTARRASRYVPAVHRATYTRPARRAGSVLTGEQPVITG